MKHWVVNRWIQEGVFCVMTGAANSGKTAIAIDWAGVESDVGGNVLYLNGESNITFRDKLIKWKTHHSTELENMIFFPAYKELDAVFKNFSQNVIETLTQNNQKPTLIVLDSDFLVGILQEDLNRTQIKEFFFNIFNFIATYQCAVLLVANNLKDIHEISDIADTVLEVKNGYIHMLKSRYGEKQRPLKFRYDGLCAWFGDQLS